MHNEISQLLTFLRFVEGLKHIIRFEGQAGFVDYPNKPSRYESVADHTWRMAIALIAIKPHLAKPLDLEKALKMAVIHDIPEIETGDLPAQGTNGTDSHTFDPNRKEAKFIAEQAAAKKIFGLLPEEQSTELYTLWMEFEKRESFEAQVVNAIDKIDAKLQALHYSQGNFYPWHFDFTKASGVKDTQVDPFLAELMNTVVGEVEREYKEFPTKG